MIRILKGVPLKETPRGGATDEDFLVDHHVIFYFFDDQLGRCFSFD